MSTIKQHIENTKLAKEFLAGIKYFYDFKTKIFSKYSISDIDHFKEIQSGILKIENVQELKIMRKNLIRAGMKTLKNFIIIESFYVFLIENAHLFNVFELKNVKEGLLVDFLYEKSLKNKTSSIMLYKVVLSDLFHFLDKKYGYCFDFCLRTMKFNKESSLPVFLPEPKFLNLIDYLKHHHFKKDYDKRNCLIVLIVSLIGCRSAEVMNLKLSDFKIIKDRDGEEYYSFKLKGKGNKERMASVKKKILEKPLQNWLHCDLRRRKRDQNFLFSTTKSRSDTTRNFLIKTLKALSLIEDEKYIGLHMLRHSFASYIYQNTKDLILIQNLLGHTSVEVTKIYVHNTIDFSQQVLKLF